MRMERHMNFKEEYTSKKEQIEEILKEYLPPKEGYQKIIMEAMEYSLMAGGKRLRPMLMMGDVPSVRGDRRYNPSVYGSH